LAANLWGEKLINTDNTSKYISEFKKNCQFCVDLGIKTIRVDTVQPPTIFSEVDYDTAFDRVTKTWLECVRIAEDHGLLVTWEFEPGFAFNKPSDIMKILDVVDSPNFGLLYDTCHGEMVSVVGARHPGSKEILPGGQVEFIQKIGSRINHIHLIDSDHLCHKNADGSDETSTHMPFGDGFVDFDAVVPELMKVDMPHDWWTIDLCFWDKAWDVTERCKKDIDQLNLKYAQAANAN
jgi:sugar phosphate isomerase/epimerase